MNEKKPLKNDNNKKSAIGNVPNRDKNGRFSGQKKADGNGDDKTVKIKIVKGDAKNSSSPPSNGKDKQGNDDNSIKHVFFFTESYPRFKPFKLYTWPLFSSLSRWGEEFLKCRKEEAQAPTSPTVKDFSRYVEEREPLSLDFNGKKYYSETMVAQLLADTIIVCAEEASKGEETKKPVRDKSTPENGTASNVDGLAPKKEQENLQEAQMKLQKKIEGYHLSSRLAKIIANTILGGFVVSVVAAISVLTVKLGMYLFK